MSCDVDCDGWVEDPDGVSPGEAAAYSPCPFCNCPEGFGVPEPNEPPDHMIGEVSTEGW